MHSENTEQLWKDDNMVDVELCDTCFSLPCECRIVNIILPPKICANADNHKGCNRKHERNPSKGVEVHTYGGSDEQKPICSGKKYSIHMKRSFIAKVKSSKGTPKIPKNSTYVNLDIFPVKWKCDDINQGIQHTKVSKLAKTQSASTHLSLSSVKHKLDYNQFGNQSQQDQVIAKENNSDVTPGNPNTHKENFFTNETDDNLVSNYTCVCCDAKNSVCDKFVIFIKANYNNYIPDISEVLSHVQPKRKYTKYICKQCHTILKSGKSPFDGDSNRCNDMCEYDKKCAEHNLPIHDYTCTCCHVVSNKRHLFIKFKE